MNVERGKLSGGKPVRANRGGVFTVKQRELINDFKNGRLKRLNILYGSVSSGKTWITLVVWALWVATMPRDKSYLMVAKTLISLKRNCLDLLIELVGKRNFSYSISQKQATLFGRRVYLEGANDARAESKIRGLTIQGVYVDEITLINESFFKMLLSRLRETRAKLFGTTNPDSPDHWLNTDYLQRKDELDLYVAKFTIEQNTFLDPEYVAQLKKEYTGVFFDRFILGNFVRAEGIIYRQYADNSHLWGIDVTQEHLKDVDFISIGVDFGGNKSLTTFVATAIHRNFNKLTVLQDYSIKGVKGEIDSDKVNSEFAEFVNSLKARYPNTYIKYCFADSEAQYLINGLKKSCKLQFPMLQIGDSAKYAIIDRIICTNTLLNTHRLFISNSCELLPHGLRQAVWDDKKKDTRLDNFTSDIDILDAFEYSFERFTKPIAAAGGR